MMTANWKIQEFVGPEGLQQLETDWLRLIDEMEQPGFQHEYETHRAYYASFSPVDDNYHFLALMDDSQVRAICPVERMLKSVFRGTRSTWTLGNPRVHGVFLDLICPSDDAMKVFMPLVSKYLAKMQGCANWLVIDQVLEGSVLWKCLMSSNQISYSLDQCGESDVLNCDQSFESFLESSSTSQNRSLSKARRRSQKIGTLSHRCVTAQIALTRAFDTFVELEFSGKKGELGNRGALRYKPDQLKFYRELVREFGKQGRCEIHILELENRCIAAEICFKTGAELSSLKICYSESDRRIAPGFLLLEGVAERCCVDPEIERFNLVSHQHWHQGWRPETIPAHTVYIPLHRYLPAAILVWLLNIRLNYGHIPKRIIRSLLLKKFYEKVSL